jgi:hypothetical protein
MQTAIIPRTAPFALWRVAESFLHILYPLFGAPEDVAREQPHQRPYSRALRRSAAQA